jgi:hypothetical protein
MGPPIQAAWTAVTGKNTLGMRVAPQVSTATTPQGIAQAKAKGEPMPGSSQAWLNLMAAIKNANPLVGTAIGANKPGKDVSTSEKIGELLGPFGWKYGQAPSKKPARR